MRHLTTSRVALRATSGDDVRARWVLPQLDKGSDPSPESYADIVSLRANKEPTSGRRQDHQAKNEVKRLNQKVGGGHAMLIRCMIATNSSGVKWAKGLFHMGCGNVGTPVLRNQHGKRKCQLAVRRAEAA